MPIFTRMLRPWLGRVCKYLTFGRIRTKTTDSPTYFTSGFYKITAGPARPANYTFEETKYVLSGQIDILVSFYLSFKKNYNI